MSEAEDIMVINVMEDPEERACREAFEYYDWNKSGTIPFSALQCAMRRSGQNPTDVEVQDIMNKMDDGSGTLNVDDFISVTKEKCKEADMETHFKDAFRAFSKDKEGCIPAEELKFVMNNLPGHISPCEIEEMINIVDRNKDGKISYSEFRVMMGGFPLIIHNPLTKG